MADARSEKFYCRHCSATRSSRVSIEEHCGSEHDLFSPGIADFENDQQKLARERRERLREEREQQSLARIADLELKRSQPTWEQIHTVADFLSACRGEL